jgi:predicted RNase H-like HicB family nuclease
LSIEEAKRNLIEAVTLYIDTAIESELPIIRTVPNSENPAIISPGAIYGKFQMNLYSN